MSDTRALSHPQLLSFCKQFALTVLVAAGASGSVLAAEPQARLIFTGDVMLSREVQREISLRKGESPWADMADFFKGADWLMGNFEGSVGTSAGCPPNDASPCFATQPEALTFLNDAGFTAMSAENNHSADLGTVGRGQTRTALLQNRISAIDFQHSPGFVKINGRIFGFVAFSNVAGKDGAKVDIPSSDLRQKIRVAKSLADWVIVSVHWGTELADWPRSQQRDMAKWMIRQGADVIIGHHPHVVQAPECILGKPVFFSLGNHVFDQKYEETKRGLMADCMVRNNRLRCAAVATATPMTSSFPQIATEQASAQPLIEKCSVPMRAPLIVEGYTIRPRLAEKQFADGDIVLEGSKPGARNWDAVAKNMLAVEKGRLAKTGQDELLFTLERHYSSIDQEMSPRPYVYAIGPHGLVAKWRGTSLAWPLVDGKLIRSGGLDYLCALHRTDSFLQLNPGTKETRTEVYQWNGFGFSAVKKPDLAALCKRMFM